MRTARKVRPAGSGASRAVMIESMGFHGLEFRKRVLIPAVLHRRIAQSLTQRRELPAGGSRGLVDGEACFRAD
jgi:hypothetical protein